MGRKSGLRERNDDREEKVKAPIAKPTAGISSRPTGAGAPATEAGRRAPWSHGAKTMNARSMRNASRSLKSLSDGTSASRAREVQR